MQHKVGTNTLVISYPKVFILKNILTLLPLFLASESDAVVYVCDPSDGLGAVRLRKFTGWFVTYKHESQKIFQIATHFDAGGVNIFNVLLFNKNNPKRMRFIEAFMELNAMAGK